MLTNKAKRELKINQRRILIDSIEIAIPSPQQILNWGQRELPNGKKVGEVKNSKTVNYKKFTPLRDGLFCERIFGPINSFVCACGKRQSSSAVTFCEKCEVEYIDKQVRRSRLGYISLVSPVVHVWYLKGRPSYLSLFLGKRKKQMIALAYCNAYLVEQAFSNSSQSKQISIKQDFKKSPSNQKTPSLKNQNNLDSKTIRLREAKQAFSTFENSECSMQSLSKIRQLSNKFNKAKRITSNSSLYKQANETNSATVLNALKSQFPIVLPSKTTELKTPNVLQSKTTNSKRLKNTKLVSAIEKAFIPGSVPPPPLENKSEKQNNLSLLTYQSFEKATSTANKWLVDSFSHIFLDILKHTKNNFVLNSYSQTLPSLFIKNSKKKQLHLIDFYLQKSTYCPSFFDSALKTLPTFFSYPKDTPSSDQRSWYPTDSSYAGQTDQKPLKGVSKEQNIIQEEEDMERLIRQRGGTLTTTGVNNFSKNKAFIKAKKYQTTPQKLKNVFDFPKQKVVVEDKKQESTVLKGISLPILSSRAYPSNKSTFLTNKYSFNFSLPSYLWFRKRYLSREERATENRFASDFGYLLTPFDASIGNNEQNTRNKKGDSKALAKKEDRFTSSTFDGGKTLLHGNKSILNCFTTTATPESYNRLLEAKSSSTQNNSVVDVENVVGRGTKESNEIKEERCLFLQAQTPQKQIKRYNRAQSVPFLPSLICKYNVREELVTFFNSYPVYRDLPIPFYCEINRWEALYDVHKFMAEQSLSASPNKFSSSSFQNSKSSFKFSNSATSGTKVRRKPEMNGWGFVNGYQVANTSQVKLNSEQRFKSSGTRDNKNWLSFLPSTVVSGGDTIPIPTPFGEREGESKAKADNKTISKYSILKSLQLSNSIQVLKTYYLDSDLSYLKNTSKKFNLLPQIPDFDETIFQNTVVFPPTEVGIASEDSRRKDEDADTLGTITARSKDQLYQIRALKKAKANAKKVLTLGKLLNLSCHFAWQKFNSTLETKFSMSRDQNGRTQPLISTEDIPFLPKNTIVLHSKTTVNTFPFNTVDPPQRITPRYLLPPTTEKFKSFSQEEGLKRYPKKDFGVQPTQSRATKSKILKKNFSILVASQIATRMPKMFKNKNKQLGIPLPIPISAPIPFPPPSPSGMRKGMGKGDREGEGNGILPATVLSGGEYLSRVNFVNNSLQAILLNGFELNKESEISSELLTSLSTFSRSYNLASIYSRLFFLVFTFEKRLLHNVYTSFFASGIEKGDTLYPLPPKGVSKSSFHSHSHPHPFSIPEGEGDGERGSGRGREEGRGKRGEGYAQQQKGIKQISSDELKKLNYISVSKNERNALPSSETNSKDSQRNDRKETPLSLFLILPALKAFTLSKTNTVSSVAVQKFNPDKESLSAFLFKNPESKRSLSFLTEKTGSKDSRTIKNPIFEDFCQQKVETFSPTSDNLWFSNTQAQGNKGKRVIKTKGENSNLYMFLETRGINSVFNTGISSTTDSQAEGFEKEKKSIRKEESILSNPLKESIDQKRSKLNFNLSKSTLLTKNYLNICNFQIQPINSGELGSARTRSEGKVFALDSLVSEGDSKEARYNDPRTFDFSATASPLEKPKGSKSYPEASLQKGVQEDEKMLGSNRNYISQNEISQFVLSRNILFAALAVNTTNQDKIPRDPTSSLLSPSFPLSGEVSYLDASQKELKAGINNVEDSAFFVSNSENSKHNNGLKMGENMQTPKQNWSMQTQNGGKQIEMLSHLELSTIREILSYTGGGALEAYLKRIDISSFFNFLSADIASTRITYKSKLVKIGYGKQVNRKQKRVLTRLARRLSVNSRRLKIIQLFMRNKRRPEWMMISILPVLPPDLRPILQMSESVVVASDINNLYQRIIYRNNRFHKLGFIDSHLVTAIQRLVQDAVDRLIENGKGASKPFYTPAGRPLKSLSDTLKGKKGRFRYNLLGKRVDFSGRSVIVVSPQLKIQECGLPKEIALELYHYFLLRQLLLKKKASSIVIAKKLIKERKAAIWNMLRDIIYHHPVLLNRAPTLHRLGIQAFQPRLIDGNAIWLHPLVCSAFNADFDGDQMGVHLPLSLQARAEAWDLLWSRNNLLSPATGQPVLLPSQDMVLGFYYMTQSFASPCLVSSKSVKVSKNSKTLKAVKVLEKQLDPIVMQGLPQRGWIPPTGVRRSIPTENKFPNVLPSKTSVNRLPDLDGPSTRVFNARQLNSSKQFFFDTLQLLNAYQNGHITIHTPVWLALNYNEKFEHDKASLLPLELRINTFANSTYIYSEYKRRKDESTSQITSCIRTTAGKVLVNTFLY